MSCRRRCDCVRADFEHAIDKSTRGFLCFDCLPDCVNNFSLLIKQEKRTMIVREKKISLSAQEKKFRGSGNFNCTFLIFSSNKKLFFMKHFFMSHLLMIKRIFYFI